ncbi:hypothetical protein BH23BAC3_BH23BAC3_17390 [soil metagenome]
MFLPQFFIFFAGNIIEELLLEGIFQPLLGLDKNIKQKKGAIQKNCA